MRKLTISFPNPQIEVNGIVFDLLKSDGDIYMDALEINRKFSSMDTENEATVLDALKEVFGYVEQILGPGAMKKISGGRPVGLRDALNAMMCIAKEAAASYSDYIADEYDSI